MTIQELRDGPALMELRCSWMYPGQTGSIGLSPGLVDAHLIADICESCSIEPPDLARLSGDGSNSGLPVSQFCQEADEVDYANSPLQELIKAETLEFSMAGYPKAMADLQEAQRRAADVMLNGARPPVTTMKICTCGAVTTYGAENAHQGSPVHARWCEMA